MVGLAEQFESKTPAKENASEGTASCKFLAHSEGVVFVLGFDEGLAPPPLPLLLEAEPLVVGGASSSSEGRFRTHSNHAPASPLLMHAAKMAANPFLGSCAAASRRCDLLRPPDVSVVSSWTIATPTVRRTSENHLADESECLKNRIENMAVVRSLSCAFFRCTFSSQRRIVAVDGADD